MLALLGSAALVPAAVAAPALETFVQAVGGQSNGPVNCDTFGPPAEGSGFFSAPGVPVPTGGIAACSIAGGFNRTTGAAGPLSDATSLNTVFNGGANSFTGSAAATAQYGKVGAEAHGVLTGPLNGGIVAGADGYAIFRETFTITSPTMAGPGQIVFTFTVDGSLSGSAVTTSQLNVEYELNGGLNARLMNAVVTQGATFIGDGRTGESGTSGFGFTATSSGGIVSLSGSGAFETFAQPFIYGTPFEFALGLRAKTFPGGIGDVDFHTSALLTGIEVIGLPLDDFIVISGSGTPYDADGVHLVAATVPEPGVLTLLGFSLLALGYLRHRGKLVSSGRRAGRA